MNIQNVDTNATFTANVRSKTQQMKCAYGTHAERVAMSPEVKALFPAGSIFVETDTRTIYIMDESANDFVEF